MNLDDLEKKAREATPGLWSDDGFGNVAATKSDQLNGGYFTAECSGPNKHGNSLFIAAANPSAILDLIARCRKAEEEVERLHRQLEDAITLNEPEYKSLKARCREAEEEVRELKRPDFREMREMLRAMQAGELTVSRGIEILEMWSAGNWNDDMLPPVRQDLIEEDAMPVEIIDRLKARVAELEAQSGEAIGEIIRNSAGQIFIAGTDDNYFDMSKFIGTKLYLRAPQAVPEWKPIETAPKDRRILIGRVGHPWTFTAQWDERYGHWAIGPGPMGYFAEPTHWMHSPAAPSPEGEKK